MSNKLSALVFTFIPFLAQAHTYIKCGKKVDFENFEVKGYELELSSEDDQYKGPVGGTWNLKLKSEKSDWLKPNKNIVAKEFKDEKGDPGVSIRITTGRSVSGSVGTEYKVFGLYDEEPVLKKYTIGGYVGSAEVGSFKCLSGNM